jgi:hypothetical protein
MTLHSAVVAREAVLAQVSERGLADLDRVVFGVASLLGHVFLVQRAPLWAGCVVDLSDGPLLLLGPVDHLARPWPRGPGLGPGLVLELDRAGALGCGSAGSNVVAAVHGDE